MQYQNELANYTVMKDIRQKHYDIFSSMKKKVTMPKMAIDSESFLLLNSYKESILALCDEVGINSYTKQWIQEQFRNIGSLDFTDNPQDTLLEYEEKLSRILKLLE